MPKEWSIASEKKIVYLGFETHSAKTKHLLFGYKQQAYIVYLLESWLCITNYGS